MLVKTGGLKLSWVFMYVARLLMTRLTYVVAWEVVEVDTSASVFGPEEQPRSAIAMPLQYASAVAPLSFSRLATASSIIGFSLLCRPLWIVRRCMENAHISNLDKRK